jgi:hypothetical protein
VKSKSLNLFNKIKSPAITPSAFFADHSHPTSGSGQQSYGVMAGELWERENKKRKKIK